MKIQTGYYKIKLRNRSLDDKYHYLRVFHRGETKYIQLSNGIPQEARNCEEVLLSSYELVKRITHYHPIKVFNVIITISWQDEDGDPFQLKIGNINALKRVFDLFPRLAKALHVDRKNSHNKK